MFGHFGMIKDVDRCSVNDMPKPFAYVTFEKREDAESALEAFDGVNHLFSLSLFSLTLFSFKISSFFFSLCV